MNRVHRRIPAVLCIILIFSIGLASCVSGAPPVETPIAPVGNSFQSEEKQSGLSAEIRLLVERGNPDSLLRALDIIRSRDLAQSEFGRAMSALAVTFLKTLYPDISGTFPLIDPPVNHAYTRILKDAERGAYTPPLSSSRDYLEHVLPFLSLLGEETRSDRLHSALMDLDKAKTLSEDSILEPWFRAIVYERQGKKKEAIALYRDILERAADAYPVLLALARLLSEEKEYREAARLYQEALARFPDKISVQKDLARIWFALRDWGRASSAIALVLQKDPRDGDFLLLRAETLIEQGHPAQAQASLDAFALGEPDHPRYLYLRARIQVEAFRNNDAALNYLRALYRKEPDYEDGLILMARLLLESNKPDELAEGRRFLARLSQRGEESPEVLELALKDAISRLDWVQAERLSRRLLAERRAPRDLFNAWQVAVAQGKVAEQLNIAEEVYKLDPNKPEYAALWAESLIAAERKGEAEIFIKEHLAKVSSGIPKSDFYYLSSLLHFDEEQKLNDLRSSLFENPRNLKALIAMFELYHGRKDERRALYYLKQALALAPDNVALRRYQAEYKLP